MMKYRNLMILVLVAIFALVGCGDEAGSANDSTLNVSEPDAGDDGDSGGISDADNDPEPDSGDESDGDIDSESDADGTDSDSEPEPVSCESNEECVEDGEYCDRPPGCNMAGTCEEIPDDVACGEAETPYCDCEGNVQTSPTTCIWAPSQDMEQCGDEEREGCELNSDCTEVGQYCDREPGCDALGECVDIPVGQECLMVITPYCDCEGNSKESSSSCIYEPYMAEGDCSM